MLERVIASRRAEGAVGQPEMDANRGPHLPAPNREGLPALQGAQAFESMGVAVGGDDLLLPGKDRVGFLGAPDRPQRLGLAQPRIRAELPVGRVGGLGKGGQGAPRLATGDKHTRPFQRQLAIEVRRPALEQEVNLGAEPAGDHPQNPRRRLAATQLDLVQERAAEVAAADLGQAQTPLLAEPADALAESLSPGH